MEKNMKKLHEVISNKGTEYFRTKILKYNENIFKISYENRNGCERIYISIMTKNGDFQVIIGTHEIGHNFTCSYVSSEISKNEDSQRAISLAKKIITKIYSEVIGYVK